MSESFSDIIYLFKGVLHMKIRKKKVSAVLTGSLMLNLIASSGINAMAIDANQAASGNLDELNQAIVDCSLIKHYISGDMGFTEHTSDEFKKRLDYDGNGVINIYDEMKAKAVIFEYADKEKTVTTSVSTTTTSASTTVTTASEYINPSSLKVGDKVYYKGEIHGSSTGSGKAISVENYYVITKILDGSNPYKVQLSNLGWVAYDDLAGKKWTVKTEGSTVTTTVTTAPVTTATLKKGDRISYSGTVYQTASGTGKSAQLPSGIYEISDIITDTSVPYRVQLKNYGWVAYNDVAGKQVTVTTAVTTTPKVTTTTAVTNPSVLKKGDKVSYSGKVYQTSTGNGKAIDLPAGTYEIADIINDTTVPYRVQLKNFGWVAYKDVAGSSSQTPAVTTAQTSQQVSASSEAADFDNSKVKMKNSSSGKYLSADATSDESNVFQLSSDSSKNQILTVKRYYNTDSVRLYFNDKQVIDIVKNETSDEAKKITAGCNVEVYNDCDVNAQLFKLVKVTDNAYKIVSAANPSVCLTVCGNNDGNNKDITQTSAGNIFLSDYSGKSEQLWIIEKI